VRKCSHAAMAPPRKRDRAPVLSASNPASVARKCVELTAPSGDADAVLSCPVGVSVDVDVGAGVGVSGVSAAPMQVCAVHGGFSHVDSPEASL